jgi:hypothetical protein
MLYKRKEMHGCWEAMGTKYELNVVIGVGGGSEDKRKLGDVRTSLTTKQIGAMTVRLKRRTKKQRSKRRKTRMTMMKLKDDQITTKKTLRIALLPHHMLSLSRTCRARSSGTSRILGNSTLYTLKKHFQTSKDA